MDSSTALHYRLTASSLGAGTPGGQSVVYLASLGRPVRDLDVLCEAGRAVGWSSVAVELPGVPPSPPPPAGSDLHAIAAGVVDVIETVVAGGSGAAGDPGGGSGGFEAVGGSRQVVIVGHAFGNRVARCVAADRPDLIRGLVLLGCGGLVAGDSQARAALQRCFDPSASAESHLADVATAFFAPGNDPSAWADGWYQEAAAAQAAAVVATPTQDWWLPPAPIPVLAVVGAEDRIAPPANAASLVESLGERGRLVVVPRAGHALLPEQGAQVAAAFVEFLAGV